MVAPSARRPGTRSRRAGTRDARRSVVRVCYAVGVRLYHRTRHANATAILSAGFRDNPRYVGERDDGSAYILHGVWLADRPIGDQEVGPEGVVLVVDVPDDLVERYEVVEEGGDDFREWCIPAAVLNPCARRVLDD